MAAEGADDDADGATDGPANETSDAFPGLPADDPVTPSGGTDDIGADRYNPLSAAGAKPDAVGAHLACDAAADATVNGAAGRTVDELRLRRSSVHRNYDMKRLRDNKEDLNDALLDFFVKLGQTIIPCGGLEGGFPSVAYLGSHFYDVLQKGGVTDGRQGHQNVLNWAKRRLGPGGLFFDGIGALAVPVNETLSQGSLKERHWWLALFLNPRGGSQRRADEPVSMICLDSLARAEVRCDPPLRAYRYNSSKYPVEVLSLYRQSFSAVVRFRASGDGSQGALPDPRDSRLRKGLREFSSPHVELSVNKRGGFGVPGQLEGTLEFSLDSSSLTQGEYILDFGDPGSYTPAPHFAVRREATAVQRRVAHFVGGYVAQEWDVARAASSGPGSYDEGRVVAGLTLPDVPQQETANDCGYFMLETILLALQLTPDGSRALAGVPADMVATLPWPTQKDIFRRKVRLCDSLEALFDAANRFGINDVEVLLKRDEALRRMIQSSMWDGPRFSEAVKMLATLSSPKREFTLAELSTLSTKAIRTLSSQHGVLPPGTVERSDLIKLLIPLAVRPPQDPEPQSVTPAIVSSPPEPTAPSPTLENSATSTSPPASGASEEPDVKRRRTEEPEHLGSLRFTVSDLETFPLKKLRDLCKQHGVLPACALERADFVKSLVPLATAPPGTEHISETGNGTPSPLPIAPQATDEPPCGESPPAEHSEESILERKARWARAAAAGEHLANVSFCSQDLEVMPLKTLRALCVQKGVLPACAVERADFVQALTRFVGEKAAAQLKAETTSAQAPQQNVPARPPQPSQRPCRLAEPPRRDYSKFLGSAKPNFTSRDLEGMPESTLRTLCIKHGVLPQGSEKTRSDFHLALLRLAVREPAAPRGAPASNALRIDDMLDDDD